MSKNNSEKSSMAGLAYSVVHTLIAMYAIYLSFKCNQGFNLGALLLACCCPWIYVLYHHAVSGGCIITGNMPFVPPV